MEAETTTTRKGIRCKIKSIEETTATTITTEEGITKSIPKRKGEKMKSPKVKAMWPTKFNRKNPQNK